MKKTTACLNSAALGLALTAVFTVSAIAAEPAAAKPNGDKILKEACAKLAAAKQFSFKAHREIDAALTAGSEVAQDAYVEVLVQRPNKVAAVSASEMGARSLYFDGRTFSLLDSHMNLYASVPMRTSIDGLVDQIDKKYGFTPPLAEFTLSDPYKEFRRQARTVSYLGQGDLAHRFPQSWQRGVRPPGTLRPRGEDGGVDRGDRSSLEETGRHIRQPAGQTTDQDRILGLESGGQRNRSRLRLHAAQGSDEDHHEDHGRDGIRPRRHEIKELMC